MLKIVFVEDHCEVASEDNLEYHDDVRCFFDEENCVVYIPFTDHFLKISDVHWKDSVGSISGDKMEMVQELGQ